MKNIFIFLGIILSIFLIILFNCQTPSSGGSGGGSSSGGNSGGSSGGSSSASSFQIKPVQVVAKGQHTVVLFNNGTVKCWGLNSAGQLGYGDLDDRGDNIGEMGDDLPTVDLGTGRTATQIAAGQYHTVVLLDDGTVKCWGRNIEGQLGYEDDEYRGVLPGEMGDSLPAVNLGTGKTAVQISACGFQTVVLLDDGTVKCWGRNNYGQLGYGDTENRGDESGEMGDALATVNLGTGITAVQIGAGYYHTVALLDDGTIKCWGRSADGQLGYGDTIDRGDGPGEMGDALPAVDLGSGGTPVQISIGDYHNAVLLDNNKVKCWGWNGSGNLGYGDMNDRGDTAGEMGDDLDSVDLGSASLPVKIVAGYNHTIVILDDGNIKCWGNNNFGQLGYGDIEMRGNESGEMGDDLLTVDLGTGKTAVQIAAGRYFTVVILNDDTVKSWGQNNYGQLGYGDTTNRGDNPDEMGDYLDIVDL